MTIRECGTEGCEAFAVHGETKCHSCLVAEHKAAKRFTEADYVAQVERLSRGLELARAERNALAAEVERLRQEWMEVGATQLALKRAEAEVERLRKLVDAYGPHTCEAHHGARRACGQCLDSARQLARSVAKERDEARAEVERVRGCLLHAAGDRDEHWARIVELQTEEAELRAEVERITKERDDTRADANAARGWVGQLRADVAVMRAERDEALREVELLRTKASDDWDLALRERDRAVELRNAMATDVLACLAAAGIATPVEGYVKASWAVSGDIARLARERDEARAEVERLKAEVESLKEGHVYVCSDCLEDPCECGTAQELAEAAHWLSTRAADPKPTPPVDVPDLSRAYHECNGCVDCDPAHFQPPAKTLSVPTTSEAEAEAAEARFEKLLAAKRAKHVEQPAPTGNGAEVFRVAIAECPSVSLAEVLKAREAVGIERYGTTLRTHNGRDAVRDLREELADAYVYATQAGMEAGEPQPDHLLRAVRWALVEAWRALEEFEYRRRALRADQPRAHEASPTAVEFVDLTGGAS